MKDFFKALKLLKYGLQLKTLIILSSAFFIFGIVIELFMKGTSIDMISGLYMTLSGAFIYQLMVTASISSLVQTSPFRRRMQTIYPAVTTLITMLFTFSTFVIMRSVRITKMGGINASPEALANAKGIFLTAILAALLFAYSGICYKNYIFSLIIVAVLAFGIAFSAQLRGSRISMGFIETLSLPCLIAISYVIVFAGWLLCLLLSVLLYRKPFDNLAIRASLRQAQGK